MTPLSSLIHASALLAASSSTKKSSSSSELPFIIIIGLFVVVYFFFLRPRQQKAKAKAATGKSFGIGDEVMSVGGIYGTVVGLNDDDSVDVQVAPDVVLTFLRRAVNPRPASATGSSIPDDASGLDDDPGEGSDYDDGPYGGTSGFEDSGHFDDHEHPAGEYDDADEDEDEAESDESDAADESGSSDEDEQGHGAGGSAPGNPRTTGGASSEDD